MYESLKRMPFWLRAGSTAVAFVGASYVIATKDRAEPTANELGLIKPLPPKLQKQNVNVKMDDGNTLSIRFNTNDEPVCLVTTPGHRIVRQMVCANAPHVSAPEAEQ